MDIAVTLELEGVVGDFLALAVGGLVGGGVNFGDVVGADIAVADVVPAVQLLNHLGGPAGGQAAHPVIVGAGTGADVQRTLGDFYVNLVGDGLSGGSGGSLGSGNGRTVLGDGEVLAGYVAGGALVGDLIPAVHQPGEDIYLGAVGQLLQHGAAGAGFSTEPEAAALGVDGAGGGKGGGNQGAGQQQAGGETGYSVLEINIDVLLFLCRRVISSLT